MSKMGMSYSPQTPNFPPELPTHMKKPPAITIPGSRPDYNSFSLVPTSISETYPFQHLSLSSLSTQAGGTLSLTSLNSFLLHPCLLRYILHSAARGLLQNQKVSVALHASQRVSKLLCLAFKAFILVFLARWLGRWVDECMNVRVG